VQISGYIVKFVGHIRKVEFWGFGRRKGLLAFLLVSGS
jgi:hypothetical protein